MKLNIEAPFLISLGRYTDAVIATLYFSLCCIPMITIGAATTALYSSLFAIQTDSCGSVTKKSFSAFKEDFSLSTKTWLIMLALGLVLMLDYWYWLTLPTGKSIMAALVVVVSVFLTALYGVYGVFLFPGIAKFKVSIRQAFSNAIYFAVSHPLKTVLLLTLQIINCVLYFLLPLFSIPICTFLFYWSAKVLANLFGKHIPLQVNKE